MSHDPLRLVETGDASSHCILLRASDVAGRGSLLHVRGVLLSGAVLVELGKMAEGFLERKARKKARCGG